MALLLSMAEQVSGAEAPLIAQHVADCVRLIGGMSNTESDSVLPFALTGITAS